MPSTYAPAAVQAGGNILSTVVSAAATARQNRLAREYADKAYSRERADALTDWERQNAYNSPAAQMQRYRDAGLNPHLIYGQQNTAGDLRNVDMQSGQFRTPDFSGIARAGSFLHDAQDYEIKAAQLDNLRADNTVKLEQALLTRAQTDQYQANTERSRFDLGFETELRSTSADLRRENLRSLRQGMNLALNADERAAAQNASSLKEAGERILNMRVQRAHANVDIDRLRSEIHNKNLSSRLSELEIELREKGITSSMPIYWQVLGRALSDFSIQDMIKGLGDRIPSLFPQFKN